MTRFKLILSALAMFGLILSAGCGKEEAKSEGDSPEAAKPAEEGATPTAAEKPADKPAAGGDMNKEEMAEKMLTMFKAMAKAATDNKGNCDAMADAMEKIINDNKALMEAGKNFDKDPENKKWFEETHGEQIKEIMGSMMAPMMECQDNEKLKKVFESMQ